MSPEAQGEDGSIEDKAESKGGLGWQGEVVTASVQPRWPLIALGWEGLDLKAFLEPLKTGALTVRINLCCLHGPLKIRVKPSRVAHLCNPSPWDAEARESF